MMALFNAVGRTKMLALAEHDLNKKAQAAAFIAISPALSIDMRWYEAESVESTAIISSSWRVNEEHFNRRGRVIIDIIDIYYIWDSVLISIFGLH